MRLRFWCGLGSALALVIVAMPSMAEQYPSAIATEGNYHLSPHRPTMDDAQESDSAIAPQKPLVVDKATGLLLMPSRSAIVENPANLSLSPHKPSVDEMPTAAPMPAMPRQPAASLPPIDTANMRQPEAAQQLMQPQAQASPVTPVVGPDNATQAQSGMETGQAQAPKKKNHNEYNRHLPKPYGANMQISPMMGLGAACINSSVTICGKTMPVPAGPIGAVANLTAPFPYLPQTFTAQCLAINGVPSYRIIDATQVTCELQSCAPSDVTICGAPVNVPASAKVGNALKVPIPPSMLANPATSYNMALRVRCGQGPNATATYRVENEAEISCNQFPCQTSNVRLCNAAIEVPGGSPLGSVLTLTMPPPFAPDQFAVQCLGTMGRQPVYQIIDHAYVSCNRLDN